jgi:hypothetical protein
MPAGQFAPAVPAPTPGAWPPPAPGYPVAPPGYWYPPQPKTAGAAVAALVLGIMSFFVWFLGIITAPPAIVLGLLGRRKVNDTPAEWRGKGMATAGLVLGFVWMGLATLIVGLLVVARLGTE